METGQTSTLTKHHFVIFILLSPGGDQIINGAGWISHLMLWKNYWNVPSNIPEHNACFCIYILKIMMHSCMRGILALSLGATDFSFSLYVWLTVAVHCCAGSEPTEPTAWSWLWLLLNLEKQSDPVWLSPVTNDTLLYVYICCMYIYIYI